MVVAGAPPPTRTIERIETELGWEFIQIYGLTETSPFLMMNRSRAEYDDLTPGERAHGSGRAGAPALGMRMAVDAEGEVLAASNVVIEGYWDQPEETAAAIATGGSTPAMAAHRRRGLPHHRRPQEGRDHLAAVRTSRRSRSKTASSRIPRSPRSRSSAPPHEKWGETVVALVVSLPAQSATEQDLIDYCREAGSFQVPEEDRLP